MLSGGARVLRWIGSPAVGWYLLIPVGDDAKPAESGSPAGWSRPGSFESALACELARPARSDRERSRAVRAFSDDCRPRR